MHKQATVHQHVHHLNFNERKLVINMGDSTVSAFLSQNKHKTLFLYDFIDIKFV